MVGLRLYSAGPSLLERVVPSVDTDPTSASTSEGYNLLGFNLPPGTIIGTQAWSLHRDSSVFPSPDEFIPERWLAGLADERIAKMHQYMMPFGTGTRMCGGRNLALMLLRIVTIRIVRNFEVIAPKGTDEHSMEVMDSFVSHICAMNVFSLPTR